MKDSSFKENPVFEILKFPQCSNCIHANKKGKDCDIFGKKPLDCMLNKIKCPVKIIKK